MKYSYLWLKELSGTKKSPAQLADLLTMHAFELEEIKTEGKETQLIFDILANRGHDALSHIGMAREISALEGRKYKSPANTISEISTNKFRIDIKDKKLCRRYIGASLENIKVTPSPKWMQERLLVCGINPINNIVDITNYIMLETGQPLHAFDKGKTMGDIIVRRAKQGEKIRLLDEKDYILSENDLVIADSKKVLALAGVMGGLESSVSKRTSSIILESANFDPVSTRKTRTAHNISTESSYRFERDIDPNLAEMAAVRAIELIQKYGGKNIKVFAIADVYAKKMKPWTIKLDLDYANSLLGEKIPPAKIKNILENLGIKTKSSTKYFVVEIPTIRIDLKTQEDLIEEIGRIYGYENIPAKTPCAEMSLPPINKKRIFEDKLRDLATGLGFSEMINYSFYSAEDIEKCNLDPKIHFEVENPMNPEQKYLRTNLAPGFLKNVKTNLKYFDKFSIFEIGREYLNENKRDPEERLVLAGILVDESKKENLFLSLKGKLEGLLKAAGIQDAKFRVLNSRYKFWHPSRTAEIFHEGEKLGKIGEINPLVLRKYGLKHRVAMFGLNIEKTLAASQAFNIYQPINKFPTVKRDISMFVGKDIIYADIEKQIRAVGGKLVKEIQLFDVFEKEGETSLALRVEIGSREKTLTSAEIDAVMGKIVATLEKNLRVKIRK